MVYCFYFHILTVHRDIIKVSYSSMNEQVNCLKNNIKMYIKTAPTCFGVVIPSSGSALSVLAKVTVVIIANYVSSMCDNSVVMWLYILVGL